jgi:hypothetical protein
MNERDELKVARIDECHELKVARIDECDELKVARMHECDELKVARIDERHESKPASILRATAAGLRKIRPPQGSPKRCRVCLARCQLLRAISSGQVCHGRLPLRSGVRPRRPAAVGPAAAGLVPCGACHFSAEVCRVSLSLSSSVSSPALLLRRLSLVLLLLLRRPLSPLRRSLSSLSLRLLWSLAAPLAALGLALLAVHSAAAASFPLTEHAIHTEQNYQARSLQNLHFPLLRTSRDQPLSDIRPCGRAGRLRQGTPSG